MGYTLFEGDVLHCTQISMD